MSFGLHHAGVAPGPSPAHERRVTRGKTPTSGLKHGSYNYDYEATESHGVGFQSHVLPSVGYTMADIDDQTKSPNEPSAAGYDLQGIGGQEIHDTAETTATQGRQTRPTQLNSHEGQEQFESDYAHPGERGFRFRNREKT